MKVPLVEGFYRARSLIADAQRCVNLYPEKNPADSVFPFTNYLTPGLTRLVAGLGSPSRCAYRASNGDLYECVGTGVYKTNTTTWVRSLLGNIGAGSSLVSMADNGLVVVIVDGSINGYVVDMVTNDFAPIVSSAFYGADRVDYLDGFFLFNRPGTADFYTSLAQVDEDAFAGGPILTGAISNAGLNYVSDFFTPVPLTGGHGTGATAQILTAGNVVTSVTLISGGQKYRPGDVLSADLNHIINGNTITQPGSGYTDGLYPRVPLLGGTGSSATADITVVAGAVTAVGMINRGVGYTAGDILTVAASSLGGSGSGFALSVDSTTGFGHDFAWTVGTVGSSAFDPLDIAAKNGYADPLATLAVLKREIWLLGELTSEVWFNSGAADFNFERVPGVFIEHGCAAKYSIAKADIALFWLAQDLQGNKLIVMGADYNAKRISTHAIEAAIQSYTTVSDAIGFTYQQEGHTFYQLTFPTADKTWVYDVATDRWHERCWIDGDGAEHRHRAQTAAFAGGVNVVGDWEDGRLYKYDIAALTDDGDPITRRRGFPHLKNEGRRVSYRHFIAEMETGTIPGTSPTAEPFVYLRWSDDKGYSWSNPIQIGLGAAGQYIRQAQAWRLGMARDRVFEVFWSFPYSTALCGAFVEPILAAT